MRNFRSDKVTKGKSAAAARSLWQAGGMKPDDFGKPIIAVANSFTEFVPGHVSPEAANGGALALVRDGDTIEIDIPARSINVAISDEELAQRRAATEALPAIEAWQPVGERTRVITRALKAYAAFATSTDRGGFRDI